jgi:uncharacterized protein YjbI with pentapeptide repeats
MANKEHIELLRQGTTAWNQWRERNPEICPDLLGANLNWANFVRVNLKCADLRRASLRGANLSWADLSEANLSGVDLSRANLSKANLSRANLSWADLTGVKLSEANLSEADLMGVNLGEADLSWVNLKGADLSWAKLNLANLKKATLIGANFRGASLRETNLNWADLSKVNLSWADLSWAQLSDANLSEANLSGTYLTYAQLIRTNLKKANLESCSIYGISAWGLNLEEANQSNLIVTPLGEPTITVDNIEVAQFIYLLLNNQKIRDVIDTITTKVVLILGCSVLERKAVFGAIREELRKHNYLPVLFDFDKSDKSSGQVIIETIIFLARMSRFIIMVPQPPSLIAASNSADVANPGSIFQELAFIIPNSSSVPVQSMPIESTSQYDMLEVFKKFGWVLEIYRYNSIDNLLTYLREKVIVSAEANAKELQHWG